MVFMRPLDQDEVVGQGGVVRCSYGCDAAMHAARLDKHMANRGVCSDDAFDPGNGTLQSPRNCLSSSPPVH
jgi:hypothetical protein